MRSALATVRSARGALAAHVISLVLGLGYILALDRRRWFVWDEWAFFRSYHPHIQAGDWQVVLAPYLSHWTMLPVLWYEVAYRLVGVRHYWVYLLPVLLAHIGLVACLRVLMMRAGVGGWTATLACLLLLLTGAGADNLWLAWQLEFVGAVFFGMLQLVLADHEGGVGLRDALGALAGVLALTCSAVGIAMIPVTGICLALRRRWTALAVGVVPPLVVEAWWYLSYGRPGYPGMPAAGPAPPFTTFVFANVPPFVVVGITTALDHLAGITGVAPLLILGMVLGGALLGVPLRARGSAAVWAAAAGAVGFFVLTAMGRVGNGPGYAAYARYSYVAVALTLPLLAVVVSRSMRTPGLALAFAAFFAWALVSNVSSLYLQVQHQTALGLAVRAELLQRAADPNLAARPPTEGLHDEAAMWVDNAVILYLRRDGALPKS